MGAICAKDLLIAAGLDVSGRGWTPDRTRGLRLLWREGLSASQIASSLGHVTRNAVIGKVHRLGLAGRASPSRPSRRQARAARARAFPSPPPAVRRVMSLPSVAIIPALAPLTLENGERAGVLAINDAMCKYPIGDPQHDDFAFCARAVADEGPYCADHARLCYQPAAKRARRERRDAHDVQLAQYQGLMRARTRVPSRRLDYGQ